MRRLSLSLAAVLPLVATGALAQENFDSWPVIDGPFPSTGGGGVMIEGYDPKVVGGKCVTPFVARMPDGARYNNMVEFEATPTAGGVLCAEGKWRSADGGASGATPIRVFIKNGVARRSP